MVSLREGKTNWEYIFVIIVLAVVVAQWTLSLLTEQENLLLGFPRARGLEEIKKEVLSPQENEGQETKEGEIEEKEPPEQEGQPEWVVRSLDKELIFQKIEQGKAFLYLMEDEEKHGFHKYYYAQEDSFEPRLHTVYSASIIYTFLYIYDLPSTISQKNSSDGEISQKMVLGLENDEEILTHLPKWGSFLLSMQNRDEDDKRYGAFHYSYFLSEAKKSRFFREAKGSYYLDTEEKEKKFVVGTSALSIFTLLRLYDLTGESKYLESAKLAGDWLTTMQEEDGLMKPYVRYTDGKWVSGKKESLLYEGQVLSSLSKLYGVTGDKKYYDTAEKIAQRFAKKYEEERGYIEGEYRKKNPISNAWVVMSLMDFYNAEHFKVLTKSGSYKVSKNDYYKNIIFELSEKILKNQKNDPNDLLHYGRWAGAYSSSGTGWLSEVMAETYRFCKEENEGDCEKYKEAVIKAIRWLIQNTYSKENSSLLPNPQRAKGGVFWNKDNKYVRTDSVCHALNGYIRILNYLDEGLLLSFPEE